MQTQEKPPATGGKEIGLLFKPDMISALLRSESPKTQTRRIVKPSSDPQIPPLEMTPWVIDGEREVDNQGRPCWAGTHPEYPTGEKWFSCQHAVGDRMYAKESLYLGSDSCWHYDADNATVMVDPKHEGAMLCWAHHKETNTHSALFMPKWAARIWREMTEIRVQRVGDISEEDAIAEGIDSGKVHQNMWRNYSCPYPIDVAPVHHFCNPRDSFRSLWNSINAKWTPVRKGKTLIAYNCYPWSDEDIPEKPLNAIRKDIPCTAYPNPWVWCLSFPVHFLSRSSVTEEK